MVATSQGRRRAITRVWCTPGAPRTAIDGGAPRAGGACSTTPTSKDRAGGPRHAACRESVTGEIGDRWSGGQLVLKPGKSGTQEKTVPIEIFFRKIVAVREKLRVLEQRINAHPKLADEDRLQLQDYITGHGSLTTFNVLFDPADRFAGTGGKDEATGTRLR
jgi:hypothetical protein